MKPFSVRLFAILLVLASGLALVPGGLGALDLPGIDLEAASYRDRILAESKQSAAQDQLEALHREAKLAQSEQRWRDAVRTLERIVAANPDDFFAWISLAAAWRHVDAAAAEITAAAHQAWTLADNYGRRSVALLLITENLHQRSNDPLFKNALQEAGDLASALVIALFASKPPRPEADQGEDQEVVQAEATQTPFALTDLKQGMLENDEEDIRVPQACAYFNTELDAKDPDRYREYIELGRSKTPL